VLTLVTLSRLDHEPRLVHESAGQVRGDRDGYPLLLLPGLHGGASLVTLAPITVGLGVVLLGDAPAVVPPDAVALGRIELLGDLRGHQLADLFIGVRPVEVVKNQLVFEDPMRPPLLPGGRGDALSVKTGLDGLRTHTFGSHTEDLLDQPHLWFVDD